MDLNNFKNHEDGIHKKHYQNVERLSYTVDQMKNELEMEQNKTNRILNMQRSIDTSIMDY